MQNKKNISIQFVTETNNSDILKLQIKKEQENFIESITQCLEEASHLSLWRPVGIYSNENLIGFAMYGLWENEGEQGRVWLDRFLIDKKYQGKGYGEAAIQALIEIIEKEYHCNEIFLSLYIENTSAIHLYEKVGFCFNGESDEHGEKLMVLKLKKEK